LTLKTVNNLATLKNLGLSDIEAGVYLSLLKLGGSQASKIAKDVGIKRTTVYPILKKLAEGGFVTVYFKKNRKYYHAQKPQRVAALFGKKLDSFYAMIPTLEQLEKKETQTTGLRFIETLDELKQFYTGILDEYKDQEYYVIGNAQHWEDLDNEWFQQFRHDRGRNNIKTKLLLTKDSEGSSPTDPALLRDVKFLPSKYSYKSSIDIFDNKIVVISPELSSLAVVIQIPIMQDVFGSIFQMLWDTVEALEK